jgi:hemerythrin
MVYAAASVTAAELHFSQHKAFVEQVATVQVSMKAGQQIPKAAPVNFLTHWLADHALNADRKLGQFICDHLP